MKELSGYPEGHLVTNRAAVLLHGGSEAFRRSWAEDAAAAFVEQGPLVELQEPDEGALAVALAKSEGVIYVPDVALLPWDLQREIARQLHEKEERPKWILGLSMSPEGAVTKGVLRDDLVYALARARLDLGDAAVKASMKKRRAKAGKKR